MFSANLRDAETSVEQRLDWLSGLQRQHCALLTSPALRPVLGRSRGSTFCWCHVGRHAYVNRYGTLVVHVALTGQSGGGRGRPYGRFFLWVMY